MASTAPSNSNVWLPVHIGEAQWSKDGKAAVLTNGAIEVSWPGGGHRMVRFVNHLTSAPETVDLAPFTLTFRDGRTLSADEMTLNARPERVSIGAVKVPRAGDGFKGEALVMNLEDARSGLRAKWTVELRSGANYARETVELLPQTKT